MERRVKYYTAQQAQLSLDRLNSLMPDGKVYLNDYLSEYNYFYVPVYDGFIDVTVEESERVSYESLFTNDELERVYTYTGVFSVTNNTIADKNFELGVNILHSEINIYGCLMSQSEVDTVLTYYIDNYENIETASDGFKSLHIGGSEYYPELANSTPSQSVIDAADELAKTNTVQINYWDGSKNVSLPSSQVEIKTDNDYNITNVGLINRGVVSVADIEEDTNVFFMKREIFQRFAFSMNGKKYNESLFKCCVIFDDNLNIIHVFEKEDATESIELKGLNLAYAPFDFFMTVIALPELGDPDLTVWNDFILTRKFNQEKFVRVFQEIDLTPLD